MSISRRMAAAGGLAAAAALATGGVALATAPHKGWPYRTPLLTKTGVQFKVSQSGKKVVELAAGVPVHCSGNAGGFPTPRNSGSGKITSAGTFKVVLKLYPPGPSGVASDGTDTVTGKFVAGGKAKGKVTSHFDFTSATCQRHHGQIHRDGHAARGVAAGVAPVA